MEPRAVLSGSKAKASVVWSVVIECLLGACGNVVTFCAGLTNVLCLLLWVLLWGCFYRVRGLFSLLSTLVILGYHITTRGCKSLK